MKYNNISGIAIDAIGNNGADVTSYLGCGLFEKQLPGAMPDLLILSLGINDAHTNRFDPEEYKEHYRELIRKVIAVNPNVAILFTTNNDSYNKRRYSNKNGPVKQQTILELAAKTGTVVCDPFEIMGGYGSIDQWAVLQMTQRDRVHFTKKGYWLIGELLAEAIADACDTFEKQSNEGD